MEQIILKDTEIQIKNEKTIYIIYKREKNLQNYKNLIFLGFSAFFKYVKNIKPFHNIIIIEVNLFFKQKLKSILKKFLNPEYKAFIITKDISENIKNVNLKRADTIILREEITYKKNAFRYKKILEFIQKKLRKDKNALKFIELEQEIEKKISTSFNDDKKKYIILRYLLNYE